MSDQASGSGGSSIASASDAAQQERQRLVDGLSDYCSYDPSLVSGLSDASGAGAHDDVDGQIDSGLDQWGGLVESYADAISSTDDSLGQADSDAAASWALIGEGM